MEIASTPTIEIHDPLLVEKGIQLLIKREDLNHPVVSGNKFRKLKYNLIEAKNSGHQCLITFGGAYSNHIYALAGAGKALGFQTIGVIRGEKVLPLNPTLSFAVAQGMKLHYVTREEYRNKHSPEFLSRLKSHFGEFYLIPEGGTNAMAIKGCEEILEAKDIDSCDIVSCPVGTGGTIAGLISALRGKKKVLGFSSLKGDFLSREVKSLLDSQNISHFNWTINNDHHFGGYAKVKPELIKFVLNFEERHSIPLEPIYTGKMLYGLFDMIINDKFERGSRILAIHTGGLQGNAGFGFRKSF